MSHFAMRVRCRETLATNESPPVVRWSELTTTQHAEEDMQEMWVNFYNQKEQRTSSKKGKILR